MKYKLIFTMVIWVLLISTMAYGKELPNIDIRCISQGIVRINYKSNQKIKVIIKNEKEQYTYNLTGDGRIETFPLQLGNGKYEVSVYENTTEVKYKKLITREFELVDLKEENIYLNSIQNLNWDVNNEAIKMAQGLAGSISSDEEKIAAIYKYIVSNFSYNEAKIETLAYNYIPEIDTVLQDKSGICYDFASLFAAMLRSSGIPTKLVTGYTSNAIGYHSWNEVYDKEAKEWFIIDLTYDVQIRELIHELEMKKNKNLYRKIKEY